jgi:hypothetical protein
MMLVASSEQKMIDPALLSATSALVGALLGGGASLAAAVYTQRCQDRLQPVDNLDLPKRMPVPEVANHLVCSFCGSKNSDSYIRSGPGPMPGCQE